MTKTNPIIAGEFLRLEEEKRYKSQNGLWRKWGPYLSERQWGTVREDYSETATRGIICPTIMPAVALTDGAKMASPDLPIITKDFAFPSRSGTNVTLSSRSACSD